MRSISIALMCAIALVGAMMAAPIARGQIVELGPTDDSWVGSWWPQTDNYGDAVTLGVASLDGYDGIRRSFLQFDLSSVSLPIVSATLNLYVVYGADLYVGSYLVADDTWEEMTIIWTNQPPMIEPPSDIQYCVNGWMSFDVTGLAQGEQAGDDILSIGLKAPVEEEPSPVISFVSKENTTWPWARPELSLDVIPEPTSVLLLLGAGVVGLVARKRCR